MDGRMTLSILIATMPSRRKDLAKLLSRIDAQTPMRGGVEVLWDNSMDYNIGVKRNNLLSRATSEYVVFIDDDDWIVGDYVSRILRALESKPDCVGISGIITTDGRKMRKWHISREYGHWHTKNGVYLRTPNHISPVKRSLALQAGFPETSYGEDAEYSRRLLPLLKTEVKVPGLIYHYKFISKK